MAIPTLSAPALRLGPWTSSPAPSTGLTGVTLTPVLAKDLPGQAHLWRGHPLPALIATQPESVVEGGLPAPCGSHKETLMNGNNGSKTLVRSRKSRMLAGVCAGAADYFGVDVTLVRVLAVVLCLITGGAGVLAYLAAWVIIPEEGENDSIAGNLTKNRGSGS